MVDSSVDSPVDVHFLNEKMISLQVNDAALRQAFGLLEKQVRFAAALALTRTAQDAQAEVRRQLHGALHHSHRLGVQGHPYSPGRHKNALSASVLVMDRFMALQGRQGFSFR